MRIVYANAKYRHHTSEGGPAHMRQFIENASALGHELWMWHGEPHPLTKPVPRGKLERLRLFRSIDVFYYRIEFKPPLGARVILPPYRKWFGNPIVAWEFNTVPEYGRLHGLTEQMVRDSIAQLKRIGAGVDVALCVSKKLCDYVQSELGIRNAVEIPNGSDPDLFRPDVPPVKRMVRNPGQLNVVWIGSANLGWHNFDLLRDAAWSLWNSPHARRIAFHVIGPGMQQMRDCPPSVSYYGAEEYDKLPGWLSAMDVGLNMYRPGPADFSSPLKIFDYMASGLTVVSTEQPQAREIFQKLDQLDLLLPGSDPQALSAVLLNLADAPARLRLQGAAGRQLVIDHYNWRRAATDTFAELQKLMPQPR